MNWTKSSYSTANSDCVELGTNGGPVVMVRNSKAPGRGTVSLPVAAVTRFVAACAAGDFDDLTV